MSRVELRKRMPHVDDLIEPRPEEIESFLLQGMPVEQLDFLQIERRRWP